MTGLDEPRITVNEEIVWNGVIDKGGRESLVPTNVDFADSARVRVYEMNGSNAKQIGDTLVIEADRGAGPQPADFKTSGAWYELSYRVTS